MKYVISFAVVVTLALSFQFKSQKITKTENSETQESITFELNIQTLIKKIRE